MVAWNEGGKEGCMEKAGITLTHDELQHVLGETVTQTIATAGFCLVPIEWRRRAMEAMVSQ